MINIGNSLAVLMLLAWPGVVAVMFRKMPLERALIWSILGGYLLLPQVTEINLPGIPSFDKVTIPNLSAFVACCALWGRLPSPMPASWPGRALMLAFLVSPAFTVLTNLQPVRFGLDDLGMLAIIDYTRIEVGGLPGLRMYDSFSALAQQVLLMLPFFLAREALRSTEAIREILVALVVAGAIYALPMLFEVRFSPQLHTRFYGFFQHDFIQAIRAGGYRPFVFMPHGLWVAFFAFMVLMSATALWRTERGPRRRLWGWAMVLGAGLVVICKSMGVIVFSLIFVPVALLLKPRAHLIIALALSVVVITYPALRGLGLIPLEALVQQVAERYPDRAQSLEYRFDNENEVLAHAEAKPLLGWGGWGRFFPHDPETGRTEVVVDGLWIIAIGNNGWLGYAALFGLLALPIWSLAWYAWRAGAAPPASVSILTLVLAVNLVDLLPNATLIPFTWLICGALLGHAEALGRKTVENRRTDLAHRHRDIILGRLDPGPDPAARDGAEGPGPGKPRTIL